MVLGSLTYPRAATTSNWYPDSSETCVSDTPRMGARATVAGPIIGPGRMAKTMALVMMTQNAASLRHLGHS